MSARRRQRGLVASTSWDRVAAWYDGWVGAEGSKHHRQLAIPHLLRLLDPRPGERVLDVGCGQGVLAPAITSAHATYVGVDASPRLLATARKRHSAEGVFVLADAAKLGAASDLPSGCFDAVAFLLSIQDMDPLDEVLRAAAQVLRPGGRLVLLMTHPCFRVPRQSGWGWDQARRLRYRRVDRYLGTIAVPMKSLKGRNRTPTSSFHRPLEAYFNGLSKAGLLVERVDEIPGLAPRGTEADERARQEIPLFMAIRARKVGALLS
jgi:ubiquinone/menaquinone biosynthesis C-methylase UbiE